VAMVAMGVRAGGADQLMLVLGIIVWVGDVTVALVALIFIPVLAGMLVGEVRCACPDGAGWDLSRPRPGLALTPADRPPGVSPLMEPRATPPDNVPIHPLAAEIFSRFFRTPNPGMCARPWRTHPAAIHWCVAMRGFRRTGLLPEAVPKMCIRPDSIAVRN